VIFSFLGPNGAGKTTTVVTVDAESGRIVYIGEVTSSQALATVLGGGDPILPRGPRG
jgi:ABC-type multidrug transport system ATPase subunit